MFIGREKELKSLNESCGLIHVGGYVQTAKSCDKSRV